MDALDIETAVLAGYDGGGRAACIAVALWPARVRGLVSVAGYNVQNLAYAGEPAAPERGRT
jgi:pimeloyl-ACP methyl ester carboxylesterase